MKRASITLILSIMLVALTFSPTMSFVNPQAQTPKHSAKTSRKRSTKKAKPTSLTAGTEQIKTIVVVPNVYLSNKIREGKLQIVASPAAIDIAPSAPISNPSTPQTVPVDAEQIEDTFDIPANRIDKLIAIQAGDKAIREVVRVFSGGELIDNPALAVGLIRKSGRFSPDSKTLVVQGDLNGSAAIEDIRFFEFDDGTLVVVHDVYLDGDRADLLIGRGLPFQLDDGKDKAIFDLEVIDGSKNQTYNSAKAVVVAAPTISSITGYTDSNAGIKNGKVNMSDCGPKWDGGYAINDRSGKYLLTINGKNFGATRGSVTLAGKKVDIVNWSNTSIKIDPTRPYDTGPVSTILKITTASGGVLNYGMSIVPAIRTRIFGQCTHHVALTRLKMGLEPSPMAYDDYLTITGSYVPRVGDQYQWKRAHTAIVVEVSSSAPSTGGLKTWTLTISEQNADCKNGLNRYKTMFQTKTVGASKSVLVYPKSSKGSECKLYYR